MQISDITQVKIITTEKIFRFSFLLMMVAENETEISIDGYQINIMNEVEGFETRRKRKKNVLMNERYRVVNSVTNKRHIFNHLLIRKHLV